MQGYKAELSEEEKEHIIKEFLPFIKYAANRLSWRLPPQLTVDDLISVGLIGLLDAMDKFDEGLARLKTYAEFRIKGAMLDELRAVDWVPRSVKKKIKNLKDAYSNLEKRLGRVPEDEEVADAIGVSLDEYYKTLQDANGSLAFRFEDFENSDDSGLNILECIADPAAKSPLAMLEKTKQKEFMGKLIDELPEKEKLLLSLYYWEELTMKEIGRVMKLSEGRVCQLHNQALIRLKSKVDTVMKEEDL